MKHEYVTACLAFLWMAAASAQTGDPHSFGRPMKWRGGFLQDTGIVLREDCSAAPAGERCVQLQAAPAITNFDEGELATIVLPANSASARSLLCQVVSPFIDYVVFNPDPQLASEAYVFASARLRVESAVLADPSLINPITGEPFGGFIDETLPGGHNFYKTLGARKGEQVFDSDRSRFCIGGIVSKARLIEYYGLTADQATAFFVGEITLRLGIRGSAKLLDGPAHFRFNVRFLSD